MPTEGQIVVGCARCGHVLKWHLWQGASDAPVQNVACRFTDAVMARSGKFPRQHTVLVSGGPCPSKCPAYVPPASEAKDGSRE